MDLLCDAIGFNSPEHNTIQVGGPPGTLPSSESPYTQGQPTRAPRYTGGRRCHICGRTYERPDHLNRHLKSHENQRQYKCTRCPKSFNRADLLNRHQTGHDRPEKPSIDRGDRVAAACVACINAKAKCQDQKPCGRCQRREIPCVTPKLHEMEKQMSSVPSEPVPFQQHVISNGSVMSEVPSRPRVESANYPPPVDSPMGGTQEAFHHQNNAYHNQLATNVNPFTSYPDPSQLGFDIGFVPRVSYFSQDMDFGLWDVDLNEVEMAYHDFQGQHAQGQQPFMSNISMATQDPAKRTAAFERSPWLWTPTPNDRALNDQHNLNVDEDNIPSILVASSPPVDSSEFTSCVMQQQQRDKMLEMLFSLRQLPPGQPPCLPSLSLLNAISQVFFVQQRMTVDHFIHGATFDPAEALPQLMIAIIAAGATLISTPAIWKMGLVLQELIRHAVAQYWETNNSKTRNLEALQAFMIMLDIGLWSGFKRKMEIAESFALPPVIILRRSGVFAAVNSENSALLNPDRSDSDAVLEAKWRKWSERESWKRLVLHMFLHDIQSSVGLQKPPLISFSELRLPLPASRNLWLAKNAQDWRDAFLASSPQPTPSFLEAMHNPSALVHFASQIDTDLTALVLLHGTWCQIWSLNESRKFFPPDKATHRLCLHTAYTELYRDLLSLSAMLPSMMTRNCVEATLISELLLMILHIFPEDLQRYAGKFGEEEAWRSAEQFAHWAKTKEAHLAIWHAGQVFRAAARMMPAHIRGFNAVAVYYASLTLWVYGLMNLETPIGEPLVALNEGESGASKAFLAGGFGIPAIVVEEGGQRGTLVELRETDKILEITRRIYKNNFPVAKGESLPPLVENLSDLLRDLGNGPASRRSKTPE